MSKRVIKRDEIARLAEAGADVTQHPKLVQGVMAVPELVAAIESLAKANREHAKAQADRITQSIDTLAQAISKMEPAGIDIAPLTAAIADLRLEATTVCQPVDYVMTGRRDPNRHLIDLEHGIRFTAVQPRLDS